MDIALLVIGVTILLLLIAIFVYLILKNQKGSGADLALPFDEQRTNIVGDISNKMDSAKSAMLDEVSRNNTSLSTNITTTITANNESINKTLEAIRKTQEDKFTELQTKLLEKIENIKNDVTKSLKDQTISNLKDFGEVKQSLADKLGKMQNTLTEKFADIDSKIVEKFGEINKEINGQLTTLRNENQIKLDEMRDVVDNKMQETLNKRIDAAFDLIGKQLQEVSKGLGEMTNLTSGVNNLSRIMSNVKTRGMWGEISLKNLLDQILTVDQYAEQVTIKKNSREMVDFAVLLPGKKDDETIYLPIDAKFPLEDYQALVDASDNCDKEQVNIARKNLFKRIKTEAKSISDKYIDVPKTTNFAIMYLPIEGLFAEVVRDTTLLDELQNKYKVVISGPTTITALLNSLQLGFKTLQIQKSSKEVWKALSSFKTEFQKFANNLEAVKKQANTVVKSLDETSKRTEKIEKVLNGLEGIDYNPAEVNLLGGDDEVGSDN